MLLLVLGAMQALVDDQPVELTGAKERTLLALLLTQPGRLVHVDHLIDELWDGRPPESAAAGVQVFMSRLRRQLGQWGATRLTSRPGGYVIAVEDGEVDATRFTRAAAHGRELLDARDPSAATTRLRESLDLWRGPAYAGIDSLAVQAEATRLDEVRIGTREALFDAQLALGQHAALIADLDQAIADHPFHERFWALRMIALYRSGRQADALRTYQALRASTREQLGFEPTPELQRLELAVLNHEPSLDYTPIALDPRPANDAAADAPDSLSNTLPASPSLRTSAGEVMFGRDAELDRLNAARESSGSGAVVSTLVVGEAGAGKTRLVSAAADDAHRAGATVLLGRCDEQPVMPYQPIAEMVRWVLDHVVGSDLEQRLGERTVETLRLLAGLPRPGRAGLGLAADADRVDLFEAVAALLQTLAAEHPVVLVLDDLHWSDPPTAALLRYVVRRLDGSGVFLMCTHRSGETEPGHPVHDIVADLRRTTTVSTISLGGLEEADVSSLAASMIGRPVAPELSAALFAETSGNPLFVVELTRHLIDTAVLGPDMSADAGAVRRAATPDSIRELVSRRVARLGPSVDRAISAAAVVGREFDLALVAEVIGHPVDETAQHLDAATASGLIQPAEDPPGRYTFTHALIRVALSQRMPAAERVTMHRSIARTLSTRGWGTAAQLAHHHYEAAASGPVEDAVAAAILASREAQRALAYEDSVEVLQRALGLAAARGSARNRLTLLIELSEARWWSGDAAGSEAASTEALVLARQESDVELFARAVLGRCRNNGGATHGYSASAPDSEFVDMLEEALVGLTEHAELRAALLGRLGVANYWTAPIERRRELADSAVALARAAGNDHVLLDALVDRQLALWTPGGEEVRLTQSNEILALARRLGQPAREADARIFQVLDHLAVGNVDAADQSIKRFMQASAMLRQPYYRWHTHFMPALRAMMEGRFDEAEALSAAGAAEGDHGAADAAMQLAGLQTLWIFYERGRIGEIAPLLNDVGALFGEIPALDAARTWAAVEAGDFRLGAELLRTLAGNNFGVVQTDMAWLAALCLLGAAAATLEDHAAAERLRELLAPYSGRSALVWVGFCSGPVDHYLGRLAHSLGDLAAADAYYDAAILSCERTGSVPMGLRTRLERCRLDLQKGPEDLRPVMWELEQIAGAAAALGMAGVADRARETAENVSRSL